MEQNNILNNQSTTTKVYCHFSFRRPKGKDYGLFAVAFYFDKEGKKLAAQATRKFPLWKDHQFVSAIQSYEHALYSIYSWQGIMKKRGINCVMLVTDNSTLAGWIQNPKKNKAYTEFMDKAVAPYRAGGPKEIGLSIGLCEVREYEKSYKFCKEDNVINDVQKVIKDEGTGQNVIDIGNSNLQYKTISQIEEENPNMPKIIGM